MSNNAKSCQGQSAITFLLRSYTADTIRLLMLKTLRHLVKTP